MCWNWCGKLSFYILIGSIRIFPSFLFPLSKPKVDDDCFVFAFLGNVELSTMFTWMDKGMIFSRLFSSFSCACFSFGVGGDCVVHLWKNLDCTSLLIVITVYEMQFESRSATDLLFLLLLLLLLFVLILIVWMTCVGTCSKAGLCNVMQFAPNHTFGQLNSSFRCLSLCYLVSVSLSKRLVLNVTINFGYDGFGLATCIPHSLFVKYYSLEL